MFGLDDSIANLSGGAPLLIVLLVAVLLGLRHAADPDHLAAVTTLVASGRGRAVRSAARLGAFWGMGHAVTLIAFGLPILLFRRFLPELVQQSAETTVAALIAFLAIRLFVRWRSGYFDLHAHPHPDQHHRHAVRTPLAAFAIGLVHGMGGSAGVGVLILAAIPSTEVAVASLGVLALFTAVSMTVLTTGLGFTIGAGAIVTGFSRVAPTVALASFAFGVWYAAAAWSLAPYPF